MANADGNRSPRLATAHAAGRCRGVKMSKVLAISLTICALLTITIPKATAGTPTESQQNATTAPTTPTSASTKQDAPEPPIATTFATSIKTTTTTTTTAPPTTAAAQAAATTSEPPVTAREPTEQEINEARKIIQEVASSIRETNPQRLIMNKPSPSPLQQDFAASSMEARVSEATTQFGLSLMRAALRGSDPGQQEKRASSVVSPLSLQILMNIIMLGTRDQSPSQLELAKTLGYDDVQPPMSLKKTTNGTISDELDRARLLRPHQALHNVVESIMKATHLSVEDRHLQQQQQQQQQLLLLNSNPASAAGEQLEAHLQTANRDNDVPLSGQLNFTLANLMLTSRDLLQVSGQFEGELRQYYNTKVEQFSRLSPPPPPPAHTGGSPTPAPPAERPLHVRVNEWVNNITQNQISDLVDERSLSDPRLALVLINAAHFKGQWLHTFNARLTEDRTFYNFGAEPKDTKFMRQNGAFGYAEFKPAAASASPSSPSLASRRRRHSPAHEVPAGQEDAETVLTDEGATISGGRPAASGQQGGAESPPARSGQRLADRLNCSALLLPFSLNDGQEMSMVVLLPNRRDGLDELIENLSASALNEVYLALAADTQTVQVELPKFSIESSYDVRALLEQMGVRRVFSDQTAELERMFAPAGPANKAPVSVGKVIHKAKVAVDEQGAEAAAASLFSVVMRSSIRVAVPTFTADHPFLYVIRYNRSNMPLFMGQVRSF